MNKPLRLLVVAQFLSAFSDNAMLFIVVAIVLRSGQAASWYVPALQSVFLIAFITLAPWVGPCAEKFPKRTLLVTANLIKATGTGMILAGIEPLLAYSAVGAGAALYSPAKYGILPELVPSEHLVRANSWIEGATIAAILAGTIAGANLADRSVPSALLLTAGLYLASTGASYLLPKIEPRGARLDLALRQLNDRVRRLLASVQSRLVLTSLSVFWACAATLRIILVAWAPSVLGLNSAGEIAELTLYLAIGIVVGSAIVPRMIPLRHVRRTRMPAYLMAALFLILAQVDSLGPARGVLLGIGIAGGMFVVPLNAAMQHIGHGSIGSGSAVALQNLFQNLAMLVAVGTYTGASALGTSPVSAIFVLGLLILTSTLLVSQRLPPS